MAAGHPYPNVPLRGKLIFRALEHRNFRLFAAGQGISLIGTWMQIVTCGWLAYDLTAGHPEPVRAFWLGVVVFAGRVPTFLFAPLAGVLADRWNRKRVVVVAQILAMIQAAVLAALTLAGVVTLWQLILLSLALGVINSLDVPARQSFLVEMVDDPRDLPNAIALNSFLVNGARILGPAIAGILLQAAGAGFCFLLNALSYVFVVAALMVMAVRPAARGAASEHILRDLAAGVRYVLRSPSIRDVLLLLALVSLTGSSYATLLPVFAEQILHRGDGLYAILFAAAGVGALAGAAFLATRGLARELATWIAVAPSIFAVGLIALGLSRYAWLSVLSMPVIGFGMVVQTASSNIILQTLVVDDMRGRVMGLYSMAFLGMVPIGSLLAGLLARLLGAPLTLIACGVACIAGTVILAPSFLRPEYGYPAGTLVRRSGRNYFAELETRPTPV